MKKIFAVLLASAALTGCATINPMAFDKTAKSVDTSKKSVVLLALDVTRTDGSRYVPVTNGVHSDKSVAQGDRPVDAFTLKMDEDTVAFDGKTVYLARMAMEPGEHRLLDIYGMASAFPFVASYFVPLRTTFTVPPNSVIYLGHVTATLRPRIGEEFRAGPVIPLIDQAASGMAGSTWDITFTDKAETDLKLFRANFPVLNSVKIDRAPVPVFDRAAVQRWYDGKEEPDKKAAAPAASATASR